MQKLLQPLSKIVGKENLFFEPEDTINYTQFSPFGHIKKTLQFPLAAVSPTNSEQMRDILLFCAKEGIHTFMRGGGTALNNIPINKEERCLVILSNRLNRILDINKQDRMASVQCGVVCSDLGGAVQKSGLFYPPDHGSIQISTIGGAIATNAAGPSTLKYGPVGNYIYELEVMTSNGEILLLSTQNSQARKIIPGLPLAQLFCGSMGILGVILNATVRLLPEPEKRQILVVSFRSAQDAALASGAIMESGLLPFLMDFADNKSTQYLLDSPADYAVLLLGFDGASCQVGEDVASAKNLMSLNKAQAIHMPDDRRMHELLVRRRGLPVYAGSNDRKYMLESFVCPPSRLTSYIEGIEQIAAKHRLEITLFGHAGIARLHVAIFYNDDNYSSAEHAAKEMFTLELVLNNIMDSEEEMSLDRRQWQGRDRRLVGISNELRHIFDPAGIFSLDKLPGCVADYEKRE